MATWQDYLAEARRFREAAEIVYDPQRVNQALSSIILAAIAANDALCLALMGAVPGGDSHARAAREMLATYEGSQAVGCAARDFGTWKSLFIGSPWIGGGFANSLARWAGCWVTAPPGDAVYASQHFLTLHALFPGHKVVRLKQPAKVTDLTTGQVVSARTQTVEVDMARGQTRWWRLEP